MKTHLDLFSGIGGFALAAQRCGYETVGFCEKEPYAQQILKERFGAVLADAESSESRQQTERQRREDSRGGSGNRSGTATARTMPRLHPDIFTLNGADYAGVDLLTGGFPCQPFSVAGKRRGAADDRAIWPEMLRVIDGAKPAWLIGENVAGIVTMELDNILSDLEALGYAAWPLVVPACAVDARHRRDRVWIIARRNVEDSAGERSRGESGNALHQGRGASEAGGTGIPQATGRQNGSAIGDDWTTGQDVAHANGALAQGNQRAERADRERTFAGEYCEWRNEVEWFAESGMGRVAHGIPNRAHRLRGLGNAIVPQVAFEIIRAIRSVEESQSI